VSRDTLESLGEEWDKRDHAVGEWGCDFVERLFSVADELHGVLERYACAEPCEPKGPNTGWSVIFVRDETLRLTRSVLSNWDAGTEGAR
jgi:hypothetical protein